MKSTIESELKKLNDLGYFVQNIWQGYGRWTFVFRSPFSWYMHTVDGKTLLEATTAAATLAESMGKAIDVLRGNQARTAAPVRTKRVRLKPQRVRL